MCAVVTVIFAVCNYVRQLEGRGLEHRNRGIAIIKAFTRKRLVKTENTSVCALMIFKLWR
jgi:hypothetical protein